MRSSAVFSLVLLAAAAPSLAAPISSGPYTSPVLKRQTEPTTSLTADQSDAFGLTSLIGPAISIIGSLFGGNSQNKREVEELLLRSFNEEFAREVLARDGDAESDALNWGSIISTGFKVISGLGSLFNNNNNQNQNQRREFEEIFARAFQEELTRELMTRDDGSESDALNWGSIIGTGLKVISSLFSSNNNNQNQKRDFEDIFARALQEEFARELMTRDDGSESDALNWGSIIGTGLKVISSLFSGNNNQNQRRELEDLFSRAFEEEFARELMTRDDGSESDALNWGSIIGTGFKVISSLFGGNNNNQNQRREFEEMFTRAFQEELARELMSRDDGSESDALNWGSIIGTGFKVISSLFSGNNNNNQRGFEEAEFVARSLNELD